MRLLVVEDSEEDALLLRRSLDKAFGKELACERVSRLAEALDRAKSGRYDAVLLDLSVDDSLGLSTLTRLHAALPDLPVVVVSGTGEDLIRREALAAGAAAFLPKGRFEPEPLERAIRGAVKGS